MSSTLIVQLTKIDKILPHDNADALEVALIGGWQVVVGKGSFAEGDNVVYFPPDTNLPISVSDELGVTKYLSENTSDNGLTYKGRVRQIKLRGIPSFGFAVPLSDVKNYFPMSPTQRLTDEQYVLQLAEQALQETGNPLNVAEWFGATKYEPPVNTSAGDAEAGDALFVRFTDIENLRNYPNGITPGENVVITEKLHGANCRIGAIRDPETGEFRLVAGSNKLQRRRPENPKELAANHFWHALTVEGVEDLLVYLISQEGNNQVILFGEVYGKGIQNLLYDSSEGLSFRAFDIMVNGRYLDWEDFLRLVNKFNVPFVPVLAVGPYDPSVLKSLASEKSILNPSQIKEGVVVKPTTDRVEIRGGRVVFKYLSDEYLFSKGVTDSTDV